MLKYDAGSRSGRKCHVEAIEPHLPALLEERNFATCNTYWLASFPTENSEYSANLLSPSNDSMSTRSETFPVFVSVWSSSLPNQNSPLTSPNPFL